MSQGKGEFTKPSQPVRQATESADCVQRFGGRHLSLATLSSFSGRRKGGDHRPLHVVTVLDVRDWEAEQTRIESPLPDATFWSLAFSSDGSHLYTGTGMASTDTGIYLWDLQDPKMPVCKLDQPGNWGVRSLRISPNGTMLASGHEHLKLWDLRTLMPIRTVNYRAQLHGVRTVGALFLPDGDWLAAGDAANRVCRIWNTKSWQQLELPHADFVTSVDFLPNSDRLVAAEMSGTTRIWDLEIPQEVATYDGSVAEFSPTGEMLAVGHQGRLYSTAMPEAGRVRVHFAPPIGEIDHRRLASDQ